MRHARAVSRGITIIGVALGLGCGGGSAPTQNDNNPPPPGANRSVVITNNTFTPGNVTIAKGASVTWTWNTCSGGDPYGDGQTCVAHDVVLDDGSATSGTQSTGTYAHTFATAGAYPYHCAIHGAAMSGTVTVQ